ncbi:retrovirus-related Pol polyprotein from transposon opus [Nephila pilipes]|uniref:RNA-directed DNA polymerase n=1 Tax=Nephila pilipes TaxID=299642 RepID=A0A8X6R0K2_NEPPI|nr:retrovirus-related Pol polyprotein from transposon opus [Nephila pilipes]
MNIKITFGSNAYSHIVYVAKITDNFILGLDFLEKYNFILDFKDSSLHSTMEDVTLFRKGVSEIKPCYRIIASSDFTITARQELILKGYTDQEKKFRLGVLEFPDFENFPKGILVASTFVDITKEAIPVRCANVSDKPKIIKKGKVLATCTPVTCVERSSFQTSSVSSENLTEDLLKTTELTQKQRSAAEKMLREFKELFPKSSEEFGRTNLTKHRIDTDDIIIVGQDFEEQLNNQRKVLEKLKQANLKLNPAKCSLFRREVSYLGLIISAEGVRTDLRKVAAVKEWSQPRNVHELRSFLGLCTYYRRFVKGFSLIARPLHRLTEHKRPFVWSEECEVAFTSLKEASTSAPILSYPDPDKQFILYTDASHANVGAVLSQEIDGQERVIAYWRYPLLLLVSYFFTCKYYPYVVSFCLSYFMSPWVLAKLNTMYRKEVALMRTSSQSFAGQISKAFETTRQVSLPFDQQADDMQKPLNIHQHSIVAQESQVFELSPLNQESEPVSSNSSNISITSLQNRMTDFQSLSEDLSNLLIPIPYNMESLEDIPRLVSYESSIDGNSSKTSSHSRKKRRKKRPTGFRRPKLRKRRTTPAPSDSLSHQ